MNKMGVINIERLPKWLKWSLVSIVKEYYASLMLRYDGDMSNTGPFNYWRGAHWLGLKWSETLQQQMNSV